MTDLVEDPVCGMKVNPEHAASKAVYQGTTYYFCSAICQQLFEREPEEYVETDPEPFAGSGWTGG
jgi:YHS domain-containing protein